MTRSMTRWALAGCMALGALSAAAVFDVGSRAADAAPSVSPFAGSYVGRDPHGWYPSWAITVSDRGQITSSYSYPGTDRSKGSISGQVSSDGSYSITVSQTYFAGSIGGPRDKGKDWVTATYTSAGSMALDADGNIVGTAGAWGSFSWIRQ